MSIPLKERYFEDYRPGEVHEFGAHTVTEAEIIEFGRRFDPQPFHIDPKAATDGSIFGGLIASGWHTGAIMMRLLVDHFISPLSSMGSPGLDELRWTRPVRPGDTLRVRVTVMDSRRSQSKPDRGLLHVQQECLNQNGETVMSAKSMALYRCRTPASA